MVLSKNQKESIRKYQNRRRFDLRIKAIKFLGGKCSNPNCLVPGGCSDWRCLQIDHINGGGRRERDKIGIIGICLKILAGSKDYQLLCANCNWIKKDSKME